MRSRTPIKKSTARSATSVLLLASVTAASQVAGNDGARTIDARAGAR
jgi:hypothetical protein